MTTRRKNYVISHFKALEDEGEGIFEAIVSVFGNVDHANDRVMSGAFTETLKKWKASGNPIPIIFTHKWDDLDAFVGEVIDAEEREAGLWIKGQIDLDDPVEQSLPERRCWKQLKRRRIKEFSFAYDIVRERRGKDGANELVELELIEVGPTLKGMNPATELLLAKSLEAKDAQADGLKSWPALSGSFEELRELLWMNVGRAVRDQDLLPDGAYIWYVAIEGTFPDRVVVSVDYYLDDTESYAYFEFPFEANDGDLEIGEGHAVKFTTEAKGRIRKERARSINQPTEQPVKATEREAKPEEPEAAKGEEPDVKSLGLMLDLEEEDALT